MSLASDIEPEPKYEEYRPNYQHKDRQQFTIKHETKAAYLLSNGIAAFWIPKALCLDVAITDSTIICRIPKGFNIKVISN